MDTRVAIRAVPKNVLFGVRSIVIQYQSVNNLNASEVFEFDENGLVHRVQCHYDKWQMTTLSSHGAVHSVRVRSDSVAPIFLSLE